VIHLVDITEENWLEAAKLRVTEQQQAFLDHSLGILARGYVYRSCNGRVIGIAKDERLIGLALVRDFTEEPLGYDLQQFMIDREYQGKGYGSEALGLILELLRTEGRYPHVEVCVNRADAPALRVYEKAGFVDSGYIDDELPHCINLICHLNK